MEFIIFENIDDDVKKIFTKNMIHLKDIILSESIEITIFKQDDIYHIKVFGFNNHFDLINTSFEETVKEILPTD